MQVLVQWVGHGSSLTIDKYYKYYTIKLCSCKGVGAWVHLLQGAGGLQLCHTLCKCLLNAHMVLLDLATFDDADSLGYPPHCVPPW